MLLCILGFRIVKLTLYVLDLTKLTMQRFVLFSDSQSCCHDKFDFIETDGTRHGIDSPYAYDGMPLPQKTGYNYLETNQYGGIRSLVSKLNANDPSVLDVWSSVKWLNGQVDIFYTDKKTIRMLPVHSIQNGGIQRWDAIIDTEAKF